MRKIQSKLFKILFVGLFIPLCTFSQDHQNWSYNLSIYEVNVRQYTPQGTFAAFETHLDRLKEMGAGILWFMPIHPIGNKNRLGSLGSYYSVKDYLAVNPEFGTMEDFKSLVKKIHEKGMYVIIDWVANHTAWDNNLTLTHPEWYNKDNNGNFIPPPGTNWSDVIDLDYRSQELRNYMIDAMKFWITETGIDGFRCDAAGWVPIDFWSSAITQLKSVRPDLLMLSEDEGAHYNNAGFDITYGWGYYGFGNGILKKIAGGTNNANHLYNYLQTQKNLYPKEHYRLYFTSNHDENSWYGTVNELFGNAAEQFAVLSAAFHGIPLIYSGQEAGLNKRLLFFDKDLIPWQPHPFEDLYSTLLHLKKENKALWQGIAGGEIKRINTSDNTAIFSFLRQKDDDKIFAIFNLTNQVKIFTLTDSTYADNYITAFTLDTVFLSAGMELTLEAWGYKLYKKGGSVSAVGNRNESITDYYLTQNYPNPFNPATKIQYSIGTQTVVFLQLFDILGNEIDILVNEEKSPGRYEIEFNGGHLTSGVYYYSLRAGSFRDVKKMLLLK